MATAHFDGGHISSTNNLTIYIDGYEICSYDGGTTCSVEVTPGDHTIKILVYNDASEETYWLGPFNVSFEAGREYDLAPGKSRSTGTTGSSSGPAFFLGCLVIVLIIAAVAYGLSSCIGSVFTSSSEDTSQTEVILPPEETLPEETPYHPDTAQNGFVFPNSDTVLIEPWEAEGLSDDDLTYAINEIYARHGYIFRSDELRGYYQQFSWYIGEVPSDEFSVDVFNPIEQQNWSLLVGERDRRRSSG